MTLIGQKKSENDILTTWFFILFRFKNSFNWVIMGCFWWSNFFSCGAIWINGNPAHTSWQWVIDCYSFFCQVRGVSWQFSHELYYGSDGSNNDPLYALPCYFGLVLNNPISDRIFFWTMVYQNALEKVITLLVYWFEQYFTKWTRYK